MRDFGVMRTKSCEIFRLSAAHLIGHLAGHFHGACRRLVWWSTRLLKICWRLCLIVLLVLVLMNFFPKAGGFFRQAFERAGVLQRAVMHGPAETGDRFVRGGDNQIQALWHRPAVKWGAAAFLMLALGSFLYRRLRLTRHRKEVLKIANAMQSVAAGDFQQRVTVRGGDEVGQLGAVFNELADSVHRLSAQDEQRKELIAYISHDLLRPVASMRAYLETILNGGEGLSAENLEQYLKTIHRNTQSLDRLVSEFLYLAKLDNVNAAPQLEPFSVMDLLQDVYLKYLPQADERCIDLKLADEGNVRLALGDVALLERVISNLVDNALRYTMPGGQVMLSASLQEGRVLLEVQDTGIGIAGEELSKVFEPLYRARTPGLPDPGGSGLGLTIVQKIVAAHGSEVCIRSERLKGTSIGFYLAPSE